jgi:hypothetical protein
VRQELAVLRAAATRAAEELARCPTFAAVDPLSAPSCVCAFWVEETHLAFLDRVREIGRQMISRDQPGSDGDDLDFS